MTLTKSQKMEAYTFAMLRVLQDIEASFYRTPFVCIQLDEFSREKKFCGTDNELYPEFMEQRKKPHAVCYGGGWWPMGVNGNLSRLAAIERAINITEKLKS